MIATANSADQVMRAVSESYAGLLMSVPLILAGILLTGSAYYLVFVRPNVHERSLRGWVAYLFPKEAYSTTSAKIDIWIWLLNGLLFIPIFEACVIIVGIVAGVSFSGLFENWFGPSLRVTDNLVLAVGIQFLGFWFGQGIGQYSGHFAMHKVPVLWALHRAHHSAESANLFTFLRSHPLEHFANGATRVLGTASGIGGAVYLTGGVLLPETAASIFWYSVLYVLIGFRSVDHLHIPVSYGRFLDVLIGSPVMHQVHHSAEDRHRDVNMAGAGYLFDWLFGTLYIPQKGEIWRWGLNDAELGEQNPHNTLKGFFVEPLKIMARETRKLFRSSTASNGEPMTRTREE